MKRKATSLLLTTALLFAISACDSNTTTPDSSNTTHTVCTYGGWQTTQNATCISNGTETRTCDVCEQTETRLIPALGHDYSSWVITNVTCVADGYKERTCSRCNDREKIELKATGHTVIIDKAVNATCTATGLTQGSHCAACNAILSPQEVVKANGHTKVIDSAINSTCTSTGLTEGAHCSKCGFIFSEQTTTPKKSHNISHGTCTECNTIDNAYDALAYYILCNGQTDDNEEYYLMNAYYYNDSEYYYYIYTDSSASTLSFRMLSYVSNTEIFVMMDLDYDNNIQEAYMGYKSLGYTDYTYGKIYRNTFSSSNKYVFDYQYQGNFSSLANSYKSIFAKEINLMLDGIDLFILSNINITITMPMLGFINY